MAATFILRAAEALRRRVQRPELGAGFWPLARRIPVGRRLAGGLPAMPPAHLSA